MKGAKVQANDAVKEHTSTVLKKGIKEGATKTKFETGGANIVLGLVGEGDDGDAGRGGRGGRGRGRGDAVAAQGGKRQNARKALQKTDDDFPTL